jgi:hypothetical protein
MGFVEDTLAAPRPDALAALEFAATAAVLPFTGFLARSGWLDRQLPGFEPFGTAGAHCFDPSHPLYLRIAAIAAVSADYPVLRSGRQYLRPVAVFGEPFGPAGLMSCLAGRESWLMRRHSASSIRTARRVEARTCSSTPSSI